MAERRPGQFTFPENLLRRLQVTPEGCVEFTGHRLSEGYGHLSRDGQLVLAHRAMYELMVGPIPEGLEIDHTCRNPPCVNPAHLEPVTGEENHRRKMAAWTHCRNGHPYDDENTYTYPSGRRMCRTCRRANERRYRQRLKAAA